MATTSGQNTGQGQSTPLGGLFGSANPIGGAVSALSGIADTIAGISDENKKRQFQEQLAVLSNQQQSELNDKLLAANSQTQRLQILSDGLVQYAIANQANEAKKTTSMYIIAVVLVAIIFTGVIIYSVKTRGK